MTEWQMVLLTALVTTLGTVIVTTISHRLTVQRDTEAERKRRATYLAVRVVCVLDPFVMQSCAVIADRGYPMPEGDVAPAESVPTLSFPSDADWQSIDQDLMYRILSLPNEIEAAEQAIAFVGQEISSPPDHDEWFNERSYYYGKLGLEALHLANDLRGRYDLPGLDYSRYDPRPVLEAAFKREDEMRRKGAKMAKRLIASSKAKKSKS